MSTQYLPLELLSQAMQSINWRGEISSEGNRHLMFRPSCAKGSIEEFIDEALKYPYVKDVVYFVASTPKKAGVTQQGFVRFYNKEDFAFCGLCYFPDAKDAHTVLPLSAFKDLPESLWQSKKMLQSNRYDEREEITAKNNDYIVYFDIYGRIQETQYRLDPPFGESVYSEVSKFIKTNDLRAWLQTKEGKAFAEAQLLPLVRQRNRDFYDAYTQKLTGSELITCLKTSSRTEVSA